MSTDFRKQVEQLDIEQIVERGYASTQLDKDLLRDQLFEVLTAMLDQQARYNGAFENQIALEHYLRRAMTRNAIRQRQRIGKQQPLSTTQLEDKNASPEQKVQYLLDHAALSQVMQHKLHQAKDDKFIEDVRSLLDLVLSDPDLYIRKRRTGPQAGTLVFQHVLLADTLGWSRKILTKRLSQLQQIFFGIS
ncbi:MAG TPA: hypothetical protein DCE42_18965 [Myxococcales bacterium]|nr:hypothetical protein [Deltaproteobacteria bacterium]HAA56856.1 hypothetical protein [Myxococcales bacterium]|tara:strand:+ start:11492 stop:12064 length:573 start_codon:yes stop_codon:yes gene_type:complete